MVVWLIDGEQWPRACLRAELIERGYDALGFVNIDDAMESLLRGLSPRPKVIVIELRDQDITTDRIDRICSLKVPIVIVGGSVELNQPAIQESKFPFILKRPVSLGEIADLVQRILE